VLSDPELRKQYDKNGKDFAQPKEGFVDAAEFFTSIFGGEAFNDWIGEISTMKDITATIDITASAENDEDGAAGEGKEGAQAKKSTEGAAGSDATATAGADQAPTASTETPTPAAPAVVVEDEADSTPQAPPPAGPSTTPGDSGTSTPRKTAIPMRPALMDRPASEIEALEKEKELHRKDKKKGLSKEQREQLYALEQERQRVRQERIETLSRKLVDRVSIWTEDDKGADSTTAFKEKIRMEAENLKMESFGVEILHAIGATYNAKAATLLRSQNFLGSIGGFFSRMRDKGTVVKETWHTISSAIDAQQTVEEMARMELEGGDNWTDEKKAEYERRVSGKILTAVWRMSKSEITSVLRAVCDSVLHDKAVPIEKRLERAKAMILIADVFMKTQRTAEEEGDYMAWEQLVADAAIKKDKEAKRKGKEHHHHHHHAAAAAEEPGNLPPEKSG
jgi:hypothetical protein